MVEYLRTNGNYLIMILDREVDNGKTTSLDITNR